MKLTLDTNCLINHFDAESDTATSRDEIAQLIRYRTVGRVEIVITTRAEADIDQDRDEQRRKRLKRDIEMFEVISSVLRWDESYWDSGDVWADETTRVSADEVQKLLFPGLAYGDRRFGNKIRDVDHLTAHAMAGRDIFVTDDGHLNRHASELKKLGIVVMRPAGCVAYIEATDERASHSRSEPD